jgi:hypothetical protein
MPKDASYHKAAIRYNEELAVFADNLSSKLENDEIQRWARSVSRQHKIHAGHHRKALKRLKNSLRGRRKNQEKNVTENATKTIEQEQAEFAASMEAQNIAGGGGSADPEDATPTEERPESQPTEPPPVEGTPDTGGENPEPQPVPAGVGAAPSGDQSGGVSA